MTLNLSFHIANPNDATAIVALVNSAYRGDFSRHGWTTEADFLEGRRTEEQQVLALMKDEHYLFVIAKQQHILQATILLEHKQNTVHLGMLAVNPLQQNQGIGKALLNAAEQIAKKTWQNHCFKLSVLTCRPELIAFYQRRGYQRTGIKELLFSSHLWTEKVPDLYLEELEKRC